MARQLRLYACTETGDNHRYPEPPTIEECHERHYAPVGNMLNDANKFIAPILDQSAL